MIVKRYLRVLKQLGTPAPDNLPFKETAALADNDTTVDPFDAIEMIGVSAATAAAAGAGTPDPGTLQPPAPAPTAPNR